MHICIEWVFYYKHYPRNNLLYISFLIRCVCALCYAVYIYILLTFYEEMDIIKSSIEKCVSGHRTNERADGWREGKTTTWKIIEQLILVRTHCWMCPNIFVILCTS